MNPLKTTEGSSGINSDYGEKSSPPGDPGRGEGPAVATWPEVRKRPAEPREDLLPDPREDGEGHRMQP